MTQKQQACRCREGACLSSLRDRGLGHQLKGRKWRTAGGWASEGLACMGKEQWVAPGQHKGPTEVSGAALH